MKKTLKSLICVLTAICMVTALLSMQILAAGGSDSGSSTLGDSIVWTPTTAANPLGGASGYAGLIFEDVKDLIDTEGKIAVGGDVVTNSLSVNYGVNGTTIKGSDEIALLVNGSIKASSVNVMGRVCVGDTVGSSLTKIYWTSADGKTHTGCEAVNTGTFFADAKKDFVARTAALAALPAAKTVAGQWGAYNFDIVSSAKTVVYNVADASMSAFALNVTMAEGQTIIINFLAQNFTAANGGFTINGQNAETYLRQHAGNIIFNFPAAKSISLTSCSFYGSFIAPYADLTGTNANICGTTVLNSLNGNKSGFELHITLTVPPVTSSETSSVTSSETSSVTSSETSSVISSQTSSVISSETSSVISSETSSVISSETSSVISSQTSSVISSQTSSVISSQTSSVASSQTSSAASSQTSSAASSQTSSIIIIDSLPLYGLSQPSEETFSEPTELQIDSIPMTDDGNSGVDGIAVAALTILAISAIGFTVSIAVSAKKRDSEER